MASQAQPVPGGNPEQGRIAIQRYGCGSCHTIAGIPGGDGLVGPPLNGIGYRAYVAGMLENSPDNMMRWIQDPQAIVPGNAMPNLNVSESDARDMTAYLYTTRLDR
jgi:cytochrome c2